MAALIAACPSLHRALRPPLLMQTSFAQLIAYLLKRRVAPPAAWRRHTLTTPDGGEIALDWYEGIHGDPNATAVAASLPRDAPVIAVMHTLTGAARDFAAFAVVAASRGFRVAVCLRRGHLDAPLKTPKFNLLGDCDDLDAHVAAIRDAFPRARVFGYAESAGTGLAVRHAGERGDASPFDATTCVCPGYDTTEGGAFSRFEPLLDRYLLASVKKMFLSDNEKVLSSSGMSPSYEEMSRAGSMAELQRRLYGAEGYASLEEYHANTNPMGVVTGITRPMLVINSDDDPICAASNVSDNAWCFEGDVSRALVQTPVGTHCCFFEGRTIRPRSCWAHDAALEFFKAVLAEGRGAEEEGAEEEGAEEEGAADVAEANEATPARAIVSTTTAGRGDDERSVAR
jgi:predicted alpha/beta-fold hydrolase